MLIGAVLVMAAAIFVARRQAAPELSEWVGVVEPVVALAISPTGGVVEEILVKEGERVRYGQVLLRFNTAGLERRRQELSSSAQALASADDARKSFAGLPGEIQNAMRDSHPDVLEAERDYLRALADFEAASAVNHDVAQQRLNAAAASRVNARRRVNDILMARPESAVDREGLLGSVRDQIAEMDHAIHAAEMRSEVDGVVDLVPVHANDRVLPGRPVVSIVVDRQYFSELSVPAAAKPEGPCRATLLDNRQSIDCRVDKSEIRNIPAVLRGPGQAAEARVLRIRMSSSIPWHPGAKAQFDLR